MITFGQFPNEAEVCHFLEIDWTLPPRQALEPARLQKFGVEGNGPFKNINLRVLILDNWLKVFCDHFSV